VTLVIAAPHGGGHRFAYVAHLARAAEGLHRVAALIDDSEQTTPEYGAHLAELTQRGLLTVIPIAGLGRMAPGALIRLATAGRAGDDVVAFIDGDRLLVAAALASLRRRHDAPAQRFLVIRPVPTGSGPRAYAMWAIKVLCIRVASRRRDGVQIGVLAIAGSQVPRALHGATTSLDEPDLLTFPPMTTQEARHELGLTDEVVVGIMGQTSRRKNPVLAARACGHAATLSGRQMSLLVSSCPDPDLADEILEAANESHTRVIIGSSHVSAHDYARNLSACDVILALHDNESSSGVVREAMKAGVPVVAGGSWTIAAQVVALGAGTTADLDAAAVGGAIVEVLASPAVRSLRATPVHTTFSAFFLASA
jgi:glycosyltransferase involved in cell wall biosynthesis